MHTLHSSFCRRVYPRVCGGTIAFPAPLSDLNGLSPRVRGNLCYCRRHFGSRRSIPACAGEPQTTRHRDRNQPVYPRVCGGTGILHPINDEYWGLSPRVRGNPQHSPLDTSYVRSIPACAGEPVDKYMKDTAAWVYPRVCGGTDTRGGRASWAWGLSPRVRGNLEVTIRVGNTVRSIPACAGEPQVRLSRRRRVRVYPRVCGGTASMGLRR